MKTNQFLFLIGVLLLLFGIIGCDKPEEEFPKELVASTWKCLKIVDSKTNESHILEPESELCYTLIFNSDGSFTGSSSTNSLAGSFLIDKKQKTISFITIGGTEINELLDGNLFVESLKQVDSYSLSEKDSTLKLYFSNRKKYLLFKKSKS